jgi:hypothetical protein
MATTALSPGLHLPSRVTQACRWIAPLAQALLGNETGERVPFQGGEAEILSIEP